jgi:hypothetical protein
MPKRGFIILAGEPGLGKSTEAQIAFQKNCTITTGEDVLHFYEHKILPRSDGKLIKPLKRILFDEYGINGDVKLDAKGQPIFIQVAKTFESILDNLFKKGQERKLAGLPPPVDFLVVDEGGELWDMVFSELVRTSLTNDGRPDTRKAYGRLGQWSAMIGDKFKRFKTVGIGTVLICHTADPEPESGKKGGPKFPSATVSKKLSAKADGVLMRRVVDVEDEEDLTKEKEARFFWECRPSEHWVVKMRGLDRDELKRIPELSLNEIMELAGWS